MDIGVYKAISAVQSDLAAIGISKDKKNAQQGYNFRGIDDVYGALAPILAKHGLCILPRVLSRDVTERQTRQGGALFYVAVECEFDLVAAEDGSKHTIKTFGEAMDSADKATNKAMSAAYKYAAFQAFCIPVEVEDADATTHDVKGKPAPETPPKTNGIKDQVNAAAVKMLRKKLWYMMTGMTDDEKKAFYSFTMGNTEVTVTALQDFVDRYDQLKGVYLEHVSPPA
jgi:hypothetical protein